MATKTIDHLTVQVGVTPYEHEGMKYDALRVSVMYQKGYGFYVSWTPVKLTQFGYQTGSLPSQDPLVGGGRFIVERVQKNNSKRLTEMHAALELAKEGIALYFDLRLWTQMEDFMRYVCLYGFTEHYRQQVENLKELKAKANNNNQTSTTMETKNNNIETKNVQNAAQVSNVNTDVDVAEVDDIAPKVVPRVKADVRGKKEDISQTSNQPAVTMPLGQHGSIVIAGVGGKKDDGRSKMEDVGRQPSAISHQPSDIIHQPSTKVQDSVPQVRLVVYTTKRGDQAPRIEGFGGETDPRWKRHYDEKLRLKKAAKEADKKNEKLKARMKGKSKEERAELLKQWVSVGSDPFNATVRTDFATDNKSYFFLMGAKYMDAARQLVDAYNSGDAAAIAAAEQAVMDVKNGIVAERQAAREERMANKMSEVRSKTEDVHQPSNISHQPSGEKSYTLDEVAAMLGKLLPDGAASTEDIKKLLQAA